MAPPPERAAQAIHCLRVGYRGHVRRPLVYDNLAGGTVCCACALVRCMQVIWGVLLIPA